MELIAIGEAAARLRLRTSALRYYDERGLVPPRSRQAGRRMYGRDELRQLAFLKIAHRLGIPLDTAAAILAAPSAQWRRAVRDQLAELDKLIGQAQNAQQLLRHALDCPASHPARDCPTLTAELDRLASGMTVEQLAAKHAAAPGHPTATRA
jgi:DNA-binding transcriptional MerR regulator